MYNRYIPGSNGIYERRQIQEPPKEPMGQPAVEPSPVQVSCPEQKEVRSNTGAVDPGDLLLLCIILLLLLDSEQEDPMTLLITAAAFLFLQ